MLSDSGLIINTSEFMINKSVFIGKRYFCFGGSCDNIMPAGAIDDFASFIGQFHSVKYLVTPPSFM